MCTVGLSHCPIFWLIRFGFPNSQIDPHTPSTRLPAEHHARSTKRTKKLLMLYAHLHKVAGLKGNAVVTISVASKNRLQIFCKLVPIDTQNCWGPPTKAIVCNLTISTDASKFARDAYIHAEKA